MLQQVKNVMQRLVVYPTLAETSMKSYNATGNFVWLRVDVSNWTGGTISRIEMNR